MKAIVKAMKIGNSLGLILPEQFEIKAKDEYFVTKEGSTITIRPKSKKENFYKGHAPFSLYTEDLIDD